MAEFVDTTVKDIDSRLKELRAEVAKLEAARTALVGARRNGGASRAPRTRGRRPVRRAGRPRGRRGGNTRSAQALNLVRERPGITIPEIAQTMGIEPNYLYRVLPRLVENGEVRRQGQGWHPAA